MSYRPFPTSYTPPTSRVLFGVALDVVCFACEGKREVYRPGWDAWYEFAGEGVEPLAWVRSQRAFDEATLDIDPESYGETSTADWMVDKELQKRGVYLDVLPDRFSAAESAWEDSIVDEETGRLLRRSVRCPECKGIGSMMTEAGATLYEFFAFYRLKKGGLIAGEKLPVAKPQVEVYDPPLMGVVLSATPAVVDRLSVLYAVIDDAGLEGLRIGWTWSPDESSHVYATYGPENGSSVSLPEWATCERSWSPAVLRGLGARFESDVLGEIEENLDEEVFLRGLGYNWTGAVRPGLPIRGGDDFGRIPMTAVLDVRE